MRSTGCRCGSAEGEVVALVGESGSGKSTVGRCVVRLRRADRRDGPARRHRRHAPVAARSCARTAARLHRLPGPGRLARPADDRGRHRRRAAAAAGDRLSRRERADRSPRHCARVGLRPEVAQRYPHELSGGQRQRVSIARALISEPTPARRRRADQRARRVGAGVGAQPARRPAARPRVRLPVHHPRPVRGRVPRRRHRGDVPRPAGRAGHPRADLRRARATRTRRRCCRPRRCPTRRGSAPARRCCSATTCRPRSTRRPAAGSTPGARVAVDRCRDGGAGPATTVGGGTGRLPPGRRPTAPAPTFRTARATTVDGSARMTVHHPTDARRAPSAWSPRRTGSPRSRRCGSSSSGGNAFDAAVAAGFVLHVVEPHLNGPGGEVPAIFATARRPDAAGAVRAGPGAGRRDHRALPVARVWTSSPAPGRSPPPSPARSTPGCCCCATTAPAAARRAGAGDRLRRAHGHPLVRPGRRHRRRPCGTLFEDHWPTSAALWLPGGRPPTPGELFTNPAYAATLERLVAEGEAAGRRPARRRSRRRASLARGLRRRGDRRVLAASRSGTPAARTHAGLITGDDLAAFSATWEEPATLDWHGYTVAKTGPWGQGPVLLQSLRHPGRARRPGRSTRTVRRGSTRIGRGAQARVRRPRGLVRRRRRRPAADAALPGVRRRAGGADRRRGVARELRPGQPGRPRTQARGIPLRVRAARTAAATRPRGSRPWRPTGVTRGDTCHVDVVDRWGNMVSATPERRLAAELADDPGARLLPRQPGADVLAGGGAAVLARAGHAAADHAHADAGAARRRAGAGLRHARRRPAGPVAAALPAAPPRAAGRTCRRPSTRRPGTRRASRARSTRARPSPASSWSRTGSAQRSCSRSWSAAGTTVRVADSVEPRPAVRGHPRPGTGVLRGRGEPARDAGLRRGSLSVEPARLSQGGAWPRRRRGRARPRSRARRRRRPRSRRPAGCAPATSAARGGRHRAGRSSARGGTARWRSTTASGCR